MLSLGAVSGKMVESYYEKDDYYFGESKTGEVILGEERTGKGYISAEEFRNLINEREKVDEKTRLADDLCFSAPKSVSLLVAFDDQNRDKIIQAHQEAVKAVLEYLRDSGMVQARDSYGNPTAIDKNSVVALRFDHFLNRNLDPQLHSHVLLVNSVVRAEDGKVVAAYLREIYTHKKDLGMIYRQEFASRLEKLGYQIEWKRNGTFEVRGFTQEQLRAFSSRREEIEKRLEELRAKGIEGGKANEIAAKDTRSPKEERVNPIHLRAIWEEKAREVGITQLPKPDRAQEKTQLQEIVREKDLITIARDVVANQINTAGFTMSHRLELAIAREASKAGITTNIQEVKKYAREAFHEVAQKYGGERFLDTDRIGRERYTIENVARADAKAELVGLRENQYSLDKAQAERTLQQFCERLQAEKGFSLSEAQRKMVLGVAVSNTDVAVVGRAGAGKTTTMEALKQVYESQGKVVIGVSFTGSAAKNLERETGIKSFTIDSMAARGDKIAEKLGKDNLRGGLIIVDEAGMVSSNRAAVVQEFAEKYGMKIVWVGDPSQTKPVGYGDPFTKFLDEARGKGALYELSEIHRQKDPEYKQAAYAAASRDFREAFQILENKGWLHEFKTKNEMLLFAREQYLKALDEGKIILVLADKNKLVERLNREIRYNLQQRGLVEKEGIKVEVKDTAGKVVGEKEFAKGDVVMFLRNSSELGVKNGERGQIIEVDRGDKTLTIQMQDDSIKAVNLEKYNYLTHGYAMTVHKSQGQTVDRVVYLADPKQITENKAYVAITRGKEECHVVAKDTQELLNKLEAEQKIDVAGWAYGRDEETGKLKASPEEVKDYSAREDITEAIRDSAAREIWYSLSQEEKEKLIQGELDSQTLEEKAREAIERVGEWHPDGEKLGKEDVENALKDEYQTEREQELGREQSQEQEKDQDFDKEQEFDREFNEREFDPTIEIEEGMNKNFIAFEIEDYQELQKEWEEKQEQEQVEGQSYQEQIGQDSLGKEEYEIEMDM